MVIAVLTSPVKTLQLHVLVKCVHLGNRLSRKWR